MGCKVTGSAVRNRAGVKGRAERLRGTRHSTGMGKRMRSRVG